IDRFSLLTKTPKEIFALDKGKFKALPPMTTPIEKRNHAKFYEFHGEVGHNMDESAKPIIEERVKVAINPKYPEQTVMIGSTFTEEGHNKLCGLLQRNLDIFAWKPADMTGVPRHIAEHRLNVREGCSSIGRNLEVYVDDLVIKSRMEDEIVRDLEETFKTLREINMKLNPEKCASGVEEGMFLGYKVNDKGMKVCPDKGIKRSELNYTSIEKLVLALVHASKRLKRDARTLIKACQDCQVHKRVPRNPQQKLTLITSLWPYYKWGIDIAGPFSKDPGKVKFLIVDMDYFTRRIKTKPVATITGKIFMWDNAVCRFGLPGEIISDNGKQFRDDPFKDWCEKLCIRQHFALVKHPQINGLVERANRRLGEGLKARLDARKIGMPTLITAEVDLVGNNEALKINLNLLEERREEAAIREAKSKAKWKNTITQKYKTQALSQET
nr:reverse transcriptase domain-containing protein [Tanacetum cinerariifolium]